MSATLTCRYEEPPDEAVPDDAQILVAFEDGEFGVFRWICFAGPPHWEDSGCVELSEIMDCGGGVEWHARLSPPAWALAAE